MENAVQNRNASFKKKESEAISNYDIYMEMKYVIRNKIQSNFASFVHEKNQT